MALRSGQEIPERIANSPKLLLGNSFYLECFYELIDNINWSTIVSFGNYYSLERDTIEDLLIILPQLQSHYNDLRLKYKK